MHGGKKHETYQEGINNGWIIPKRTAEKAEQMHITMIR